jgi:hypothetical protein
MKQQLSFVTSSSSGSSSSSASSFGDIGFETALQVYRNGGHSHPIATVTVPDGLLSPLAKGEKIMGMNLAQTESIVLYSEEYYPVGTTQVKLSYDTISPANNDLSNNSGVTWCQVGISPFLDFCKFSRQQQQ